MNFGNSTVMKMAETAMKFNTQRQTELSRNIANIDTPNFQARDLKSLDFEKLAQAESSRLEMRATASAHIRSIDKGAFRDVRTRDTFETTPAGNNIVLEQQMAKVNETGLNFQIASNIYRKMQGLMRAAIGNKG